MLHRWLLSWLAHMSGPPGIQFTTHTRDFHTHKEGSRLNRGKEDFVQLTEGQMQLPQPPKSRMGSIIQSQKWRLGCFEQYH